MAREGKMRLPSGSLAILAFGLTPAVSLAAAALDASAERARTELATLERQWVDAEANRDAATLQRILDDKFVCTYMTAKPLDKHAFIEAETRPGGPKGTQELSDETVIVSGDTAVVVETDTLRSVKDGKLHTETARLTATYIRRHGRWQALAEHMAWKAPSPKSAGEATK